VSIDVFRRHRFLEPSEVKFLETLCSADRLSDGGALIRTDHDLEVRSELGAHGGQPRYVLSYMRPSDLDLKPSKSRFARLDRTIDQLLSCEIEPASFGIVDWYATLGAAGGVMEWWMRALATQIPERYVHRREGRASSRADRVGVSAEKQPFPNLFHHLGVVTK
jgi:hypothetical protein